MNLYIWGDSGRVSYGADSIIVMAPNLQEARKQASKSFDWSFGREHDDPVDMSDRVKGKPDRVIKGQAAALYFMVSE